MPDPTFPALHVRPERGWLNDPNGLCRIDGTYHVFFQYNPDQPVHGSIHWGHARSTDLLTWTYEPVALVPRTGGVDAAGCWSGCVVDDGGVPTAVYTAVPDHAWNAGVALATSDRTLRDWAQTDTYVADTPADPAIEEVRDPFVFTHQGHRYAVQGAGRRHGRPQLLLYRCDDLHTWTLVGPLLTDDDPVAAEVAPANLWECPNLARVDGRWVLLISLWRWRDETHELAGVRYLVGDLVPEGSGLRFRAVGGGSVDAGPAFYAPQVLVESGRTLLWGWVWEVDRSAEQLEASGWAGALTFPRELFVRDGVLGSRPAAELVGLRREVLSWTSGVAFAGSAFEVVSTGPVRLLLATTGVAPVAPEVVVEVVGTAAEVARILVDGSVVESFTSGFAATTRAYPPAGSAWVVLGAAPEVTIYRLGT